MKIPPLLLTVIFMLPMWLTALATPSLTLPVSLTLTVATFFLCLSIYFVTTAVLHFKKSATTINPYTPELTSQLVTSGIYATSRNPMYVGFIFLLLGWSAFLSNIFSLGFVLLFFIYIHYLQILPEEKALKKLFSEQYTAYAKRVHRWLYF